MLREVLQKSFAMSVVIFTMLTLNHTDTEAGFFKEGKDLLDTTAPFDRGVTMGYVLGVFDTFQTHYPLIRIRAGDVVDGVVLYIRRNPRSWDEPAIYAVTLWMLQEKLITPEDVLRLFPAAQIKESVLKEFFENIPAPAPAPEPEAAPLPPLPELEPKTKPKTKL